MRTPVDQELIRTLAAFAEVEIPPQDVELVAAHLTNVLAGSDRIGQLDLGDVEPIVTLDPRWQ
jgi:Asp-tRNA(Asn)/Glu-tRNA(Gln) amidotransferase C subunit